MTDKTPLLVLGTSVYATDIRDIAADCPELEPVAFVENLDRGRCGATLDDLPILWIDEAVERSATHLAVCGLGTAERWRYTEQAEALGLRFATVVHPTASVTRSCVLGPGTIVSPAAVVRSHAVVGRHVLVGTTAVVGHHVQVGDHASIRVGACVAGSASIGERAVVGMGALVLEHRSVGADSVVGAGAVLTRDIPDGVVAYGVPARVVRERDERDG